MAITPAIGFGGKLEIDTAYPAAASWTEIGHIKDFAVAIDVGEAEVTHQQSRTSAPWWAEYIPGKVSIELSFSCNFDPGADEHENVLLDHLCLIRQYRYTFRDTSVWTFAGFYRSMTPNMPNEEALNADVTIRVTGAPSFVGAAA